LESGIPVTDPTWLSKASHDELAMIFKSDTKEQVPMLNERIELMQHAGQVLCQHFQGSFSHCIEQANHSAQRLIDLLLTYFPSFRDIHTFNHRKGNSLLTIVIFTKR
jgi:hypothetical protein